MTRPLGLALGLILGLLAWTVQSCTTKVDGAPAPPGGRPVLELVAAAGDTARGFFSYTAGARSTGALVTIRGGTFPTTSSWTGLPTALASPAAGKFSFLAMSATADSADFTPCVTWTNGAARSAELCGTALRWRRGPGTGTITWDSLLSVMLFPNGMKAYYGLYAGLPTQPGVWNATLNKWTTPPLVTADGQLVAPPLTQPSVAGPPGITLFLTPTAGVYASRLQFCPVARFAGDTVAIPAAFAAVTPCKFFHADSLAAGIWRAPRAGQQAAADAVCWIWTSVGGRFPQPASAGLWEVVPPATPVATTAAVTVTAVTCSPAMRSSPVKMRQFVDHHMRTKDGVLTWALYTPAERAWRGPTIQVMPTVLAPTPTPQDPPRGEPFGTSRLARRDP